MFLGCQVCRGNLKGEISVANVVHCREIRKSPLLFGNLPTKKDLSLKLYLQSFANLFFFYICSDNAVAFLGSLYRKAFLKCRSSCNTLKFL